MKKLNEAIKFLLLGNYDEQLANDLPKIFIEDYLEKQKEALGIEIEYSLHVILSNSIDTEYRIGYIQMNSGESENDVYPSFKCLIKNIFLDRVRMEPLKSILVKYGTLQYVEEKQTELYTKNIMESESEYADLCRFGGSMFKNFYYIRYAELLALLEDKGYPKDAISITRIQDNLAFIDINTEKVLKYYQEKGLKRTKGSISI